MIQYEFDAISSVVVVTISGNLEDKEAISWFKSLFEKLRGETQVSGIVDTRRLVDLNVTSETIRQITRLAEANDPLFEGSRWAVVADKDVMFGMARMYAIIRDGAPFEIRVFREIDAARDWFGDRADVE